MRASAQELVGGKLGGGCLFTRTWKFDKHDESICRFWRSGASCFPVSITTSRSRPPFLVHSVVPAFTSKVSSVLPQDQQKSLEAWEELIEKVIYHCRFFTFLGVFGSLVGSILCFLKGCAIVGESFQEYILNGGKVILMLVEAIDVYLLGTVMLVFGMGLYELFVSNFDIGKLVPEGSATVSRSNLFGIFTLKERPKWLEIKSVNELKTKVGHVIVTVLLVGLFDKCKRVEISSPLDLLCFAASILLSSGCLYFMSRLYNSK